MATPFAALETRANAQVLARLSNAVASFAGGAAKAGIYEDAYQTGQVGGNGMASSQPAITVASSDVPSNPVGTSLVVTYAGTDMPFTISAAQPDGAGLTVLLMEAA